jgi:cytoskeletal protein RodZ
MTIETDRNTYTDTHHDIDTDEPRIETIGEPVTPPDHVVEVRRRAGVAVALGAGASLVAIAYCARAAGSGSVLDWLLVVVLGAIGVINLAALLDARTPLLVADDLGVRLRLGRTWVGLPWGGIEAVEHRARRGWRDGLLVVEPHYVQRVIEDLDAGARRSARLNRRLHGAPLSVPLGLATRVIGAEPDLVTALLDLADGRTPVLEQVRPTAASPDLADQPDLAEQPDEVERPDEVEQPHLLVPAVALDDQADLVEERAVEPTAAEQPPAQEETRWRVPDPRPPLARLIGGLAAWSHRSEPIDDEGPDEHDAMPEVEPEIVASATPEPVRETVAAARAEVRHESRVEVEPAEEPEPDLFEEETQVWADLHPVVDADESGDDLPAVEVPLEPVIGPQFASARERLRLTVDELAERTRIRPHVIEAIEVDDFSACGGDFYARGHLRTLARVLGLEVTPLLETYDDRYADAPIDPRRVFEAELAGAGSIRATRGGPNWSVLVAAVMALILCWSVARLVTGGPSETPDRAILSGSGDANHPARIAARPVPVRMTATGGGARVVVRNGLGKVVFSGDLAYGQSHTVQVSPPVRIQSTDGSVQVQVAGQNRGRMGPAGRSATQSYVVGR